MSALALWEPVWVSFEDFEGGMTRGFPWDDESLDDIRACLGGQIFVSARVTLANDQKIIVRAKS